MASYYQLRNRVLRKVSLPREYRHFLSKESVWGWLFLIPTLVSLGLVSVYPVFRAAYLSMNEYNGITLPTWVSPAHYIKILSGWPEFWKVLLNTVSWEFGSIIMLLVGRENRTSIFTTVMSGEVGCVPYGAATHVVGGDRVRVEEQWLRSDQQSPGLFRQ